MDAVTVYCSACEKEVHLDKQTWNRRYREYTKKITTNDPIEVAAGRNVWIRVTGHTPERAQPRGACVPRPTPPT